MQNIAARAHGKKVRAGGTGATGAIRRGGEAYTKGSQRGEGVLESFRNPIDSPANAFTFQELQDRDAQRSIDIPFHECEPVHVCAAAAITLSLALSALAAAPAQAFSAGSPVCEVTQLPLVEMSPTLAQPAPTGWTLSSPRRHASAARPAQLQLSHPDPGRRVRGVLVWALSTGSIELPPAGQFLIADDDSLYQRVAGACALATVTHRSAMPKRQDQLRFRWEPDTEDAAAVIFRAFLIEDCGQPSCAAWQALSFGPDGDRYLQVLPALFGSGFEAAEAG